MARPTPNPERSAASGSVQAGDEFELEITEGSKRTKAIGVVHEIYSSHMARKLGLTKSKRGGKYLLLKVQGQDKLIGKFRGQIKPHRREAKESDVPR